MSCFPIAWSYILIGARHFDAAAPGDCGGLAGGGGDDRIRPQQLLFDVEIHLLDIGRGRVVAAVQPHDHAGMAAQAINLIAQGLLRDFKILRLPARPALPEIAAAPARHYQNSFVVGDIEELLGFEFAFEADGIESHIAHVAEFVVQALRVLAQHHVGSPAAAADEDVLAVDVEGASAGGVEFGSHFANAELGL